MITFIHLKIDFFLYYSSSNMGVLLSFFVTCVVCVFGINQVLLELCKAESQFLVPCRVNTGIIFNFCVEIICWKMQSSRSASCSKTPPDCYPEQEKKRYETSKSLLLTWGRSGVSRILWISLVHSALSTSVSAENCEFKDNFEKIPPSGKISPDRRAQECGGWSQILAPWARYLHHGGFVL